MVVVPSNITFVETNLKVPDGMSDASKPLSPEFFLLILDAPQALSLP